MHVLIKAMGETEGKQGGRGAPGLCKARVRPSRTDTGQALDCLSMGQKYADQCCGVIESPGGSRGLNEVYLTVGNIGFLQKQTRLILFAACFSSCDLLYD